jgi:hypothetical protein
VERPELPARGDQDHFQVAAPLSTPSKGGGAIASVDKKAAGHPAEAVLARRHRLKGQLSLETSLRSANTPAKSHNTVFPFLIGGLDADLRG